MRTSATGNLSKRRGNLNQVRAAWFSLFCAWKRLTAFQFAAATARDGTKPTPLLAASHHDGAGGGAQDEVRTPTPTVLPARGKLPLTARLCTIRQHLLAAPRRLPREQAVQAGLPDSRCGRVAARACSRFMSSQYLGRATRARETSCVRFKEPRPGL